MVDRLERRRGALERITVGQQLCEAVALTLGYPLAPLHGTPLPLQPVPLLLGDAHLLPNPFELGGQEGQSVRRGSDTVLLGPESGDLVDQRLPVQLLPSVVLGQSGQ